MIDKIIKALRIANVADVPCTLTAEQCDRLLDALALKDEEIARLKALLPPTGYHDVEEYYRDDDEAPDDQA